MIKKALRFTALKVAEIAAFYFVVIKGVALLGMWIHSWTGFFCVKCGEESGMCPPDWAIGFLAIMVTLCAVIIALFLGFWLVVWIKKNWEWAGN